MADDKILELIGDDKDLKSIYLANLKTAEDKGFAEGKALAIKEAKKLEAAKLAGKEKEVKPECFGKYKVTYAKGEGSAKLCRACKFAKECKKK